MYGLVADTRICERCGAVFVPRREHARFCCVRCRAAWNREHVGDAAAGIRALQWSVIAMTETIERMPAVGRWDRSRAFTAISEAVWQVTLVDATLVRHHLDAYDQIMARQDPAQRLQTEQSLAGLRFVRNHIGSEASLAAFLRPDRMGAGGRRLTGWSGGRFRSRRSPRWHHAAGRGNWPGTGPIRRTWRASPSARRSAG